MAQQAKKNGKKQIDILVPPLGETVESALLARWLVQEGDLVEAGEALLELETDKISLEVPAPQKGVLCAPLPLNEEVKSGQSLGKLDISPQTLAEAETKTAAKEIPLSQTNSRALSSDPIKGAADAKSEKSETKNPPSAESLPEGKKQAPSQAAAQPPVLPQTEAFPAEAAEEQRLKLSPLRLAVARNLKEIQNQAAVLTTFAEIDMGEVIALRQRYQKIFTEKNNGTKLGFMSFFAGAVSAALRRFPVLNAYIDGQEAVYRRHCNLGIAVTTEKGLVVPVINAAETLGFAEIEQKVAFLAQKARESSLSKEDLTGATFTITNGGIFGSLLSTPLLSPKQSGVLGLHAIKERPVALKGEVVIRPMMYAALSYDHRLIDGKEGVSFLRTVKELVEDPARLLLDI